MRARGRPRKEEQPAFDAESVQMLDEHIEGATIREVAAAYGVSPHTAWQRIQRGRELKRKEGQE